MEGEGGRRLRGGREVEERVVGLSSAGAADGNLQQRDDSANAINCINCISVCLYVRTGIYRHKNLVRNA